MAGRRIEWTQGSYLPFCYLPENFQTKLKSTSHGRGKIKNNALIILISQDCDIHADCSLEPIIQFVVAESDKSPSPLNLHARSSRFLSLEILGSYFKLKALKVCFLQKEPFLSNKDILSKKNELDFSQKELLRRWLTQRFNRAAFPDGFNRRILPIVEQLPNQSVDLYLRLDSEEENEENYAVAIIAVPYKGANIGPGELSGLAANMESLATAINCQDGLTFDREWIDDNDCTLVMSRSEMNLALLDEFKRWNLDHISYSVDDFEAGQSEQ